MGSRGVLLVGGSNALPRSGGVLQKDVWTLRDGKWTAAAAELPFRSEDYRFGADVAVWDPDTARAVIITDMGAVYLYDPVADRWERRSTSGGPRAVDSLRGAYDPGARRVFVFGGADTWAYDVTGNSWTQVSPRTSAPPRRWTAVVHHARSGIFVMFGGTDLDDTWTSDGRTNEWKEMKPPRAPSGREYHAMAYDERADRIVLFGGAAGPQDRETPLGDTWTYDLARNEWTEVRSAPAPTVRGWHAMAYDAVLGRVVLFGGGPDRDHFRAETWVFDTTASSWSQLTTSP
jgi:N-acetylneuraminic acid mutarotase